MSDPQDRGLPDMSDCGSTGLGRLGEYDLLRLLGRGGAGVVYEALHTELGRVVALKMLAGGRAESEQAVARFKREMVAIGQLDHPNIVRAYDAREIEGTRVLIMEYVEGLNLAQLVEHLGALPMADACELIRQAAIGLQHAHEHGLVHRDIKPSNLILAGIDREGAEDRSPMANDDSATAHTGSPGPTPTVKILDLGLARFQTVYSPKDEMTAAGQVIGTPDYMAPEQVSDSHTVDIRADVYGLGCTLYKLLTGQAPFAGPGYDSAFHKMNAHMTEPIPPVRQFRDDLPAQLVGILDRMLAKTPEHRFSTPVEVADALAPFATECDLPRLLARAQRVFLSSRETAERVTLAQQKTPPAETGTVEAPMLGRRKSVSPAHRRGLLWIVGAAALLTVVWIGVRAVIPWLSENSVQRIDEPIAPSALSGVTEDADTPDSTKRDQDQTRRAVTLSSRRRGQAKIVLSWTKSNLGRPDLWLFNPNGARPHRLTNDPASFDFQPEFSPDGRRVVFLRAATPAAPSALWTCETDGGNARQLVTAHNASDRFVSPVWVSDSRIYFSRGSKADRPHDAAIWQIDTEGGDPQLVFRFQDVLGQTGGMVTDVSPDGRYLAVIGREAHSANTSDVYLTDLNGNLVHTLWEDPNDDHRDARAIWAPDGLRIAWQHDFDGGCGVGMARMGPEGKWTAQLQPAGPLPIMPVAWTPDGECLLCARVHKDGDKGPSANLFLMDDRFETLRELFEVDAWWQRHSGRLADWSIVPADMVLPARDTRESP